MNNFNYNLNERMDIERDLKRELLGNFRLLPMTTEAKQKANIAEKMISSIVPFIAPTEDQPFSTTPDHEHLRKMISLYKTWKLVKEYDYQVRDEHFETIILSYLIKICYYWWVEDFDILSTITCYYYKSVESYREIYNAMFDRKNTWHSLFVNMYWLESSNNKIDGNTHRSPLLYYLTNYNYGRLTMNGRMFVNDSSLVERSMVPVCFDCLRFGRNEELLLLLQYGGRFSATEIMKTELNLCRKIIHSFLSDVKIRMEPFSYIPGEEPIRVIEGKVWQRRLWGLLLLLRVVPQGAACTEFNRDEIVDLLSKLSEAFYLFCHPEDIAEKLFNPRKLKHLCRLRIRRLDVVSAMRCPFLPTGLETLRLPQELKDYLNLLHD